MAQDDMLARICGGIDVDPEVARQVATATLREIHYLAEHDDMATTGAMMNTLWDVGVEAMYHLGGILYRHDGATNEHGLHDSLMPETVERIMGSNKSELDAAEARWKALCHEREAEGGE